MSDVLSLKKKMKLWTRLDKNKLSKEMSMHPSRIFYVGEQKAEAERQLDMAKANLKVTKAKVDKKIRDGVRGSKKPSEKEIENRIARHPAVCKAAQSVADAKLTFNVLWAATNSLNAKTEQMTNLSMNYRKELDAGMRSRVKKASEKSKTMRRRNNNG